MLFNRECHRRIRFSPIGADDFAGQASARAVSVNLLRGSNGMNRKQRRASGRSSATNQTSGAGIQDVFADAIGHHQAGRLAEAARRYRQILSVRPDFPEALNNLGNILASASRLDDAVMHYRKALELRPNYADAHRNLGGALLQQGKLADAAASYRRTLHLGANNVEVLLNLGNILGELGKPDEAIDCYRKALVVRADFPLAYNNLGVTLCGLGRLDEAIACYLRALRLDPNLVMTLNNLASAFIALSNPAAALDVAKRSLQIAESDDAKAIFVSCLGHAQGVADQQLRPIIVRALSECWGWPHALARVCIDLVKLDRDIAECVARAVEVWPRPLTAQTLFGANGLAALAADSLLSALLDAAPICDVEIERFLTMARRALLDHFPEMSPSSDGIGFYTALARQCFINEYVFSVTSEEVRKAADLRVLLAAALETGAPVPPQWLAVAAAYFPLFSLPHSNRLLEREWPEEIWTILTQQVRELAEEQGIGATIVQLTGIEDDVSLLVQRQYEENPYPRWIRVPLPPKKADGIEEYLRQMFPWADLDRSPESGKLEILVAGCGTGQQPLRTARQFPRARILAIDLSRSSLAYAIRKTREWGVSSIEYAQADLLKLGSLDRQFDVIEAGGVLHHLADPWIGWRALLSLLRPGGFMFVGLYSSLAREQLVELRRSISEQGYGTTAEEIRRWRQDFLNANNGVGVADGRPSDLFTISSCRDLLFHVQEHHVTLTEIETFLGENDVTFLGFDVAPGILQSYRVRFPDDRAATNLTQWQAFERENPETFVGMYQFWIRKR